MSFLKIILQYSDGPNIVFVLNDVAAAYD